MKKALLVSLCLAFLSVIDWTASSAAEATYKNQPAKKVETRLFGEAATGSVDYQDILNYKDRSKSYGGALDGFGTDLVRYRFEAFRDERDTEAWVGSGGASFHLGPIVLPALLDYNKKSANWGVSGGVGLQDCAESLCFEVVGKYHDTFSADKGEPDKFYSLQAGLGVKF